MNNKRKIKKERKKEKEKEQAWTLPSLFGIMSVSVIYSYTCSYYCNTLSSYTLYYIRAGAVSLNILYPELNKILL
jgi:hypothetical protein